VKGRVDDEVPDAKAALVPIRVDLVRVSHLVRNHLMQLATLELHLLLVELVLDDVRATLRASEASGLLLSLLLVVELVRVDGDALSVVVCLLASAATRERSGRVAAKDQGLHHAEATFRSAQHRLTTSRSLRKDSLRIRKRVLRHASDLIELAPTGSLWLCSRRSLASSSASAALLAPLYSSFSCSPRDKVVHLYSIHLLQSLLNLRYYQRFSSF